MDECAYCGDTFEDEETYLRHLAGEHEDELGRIERRRVESVTTDDGFSIPTGPAILSAVFLLAIVIIAYVIFFVGGSNDGLGAAGSAHQHGTIQMTVLGEQVDFSRSEYQRVADRFHFENGNGRIWHKHATGVTLAWGMETLGIDLTEDSVSYGGTTYRDSAAAYNVSILVNGNQVDPSAYVLQGAPEGQPASNGDTVRITVERTNASG